MPRQARGLRSRDPTGTSPGPPHAPALPVCRGDIARPRALRRGATPRAVTRDIVTPRCHAQSVTSLQRCHTLRVTSAGDVTAKV